MSPRALCAATALLALAATACGHYGAPVRAGTSVSSAGAVVLDRSGAADEECEDEEQQP